MPEFRSVPESDREAFHTLVTYAFRPDAGPVEEFDPDDVPAPWQVGDRYGLYDGDDLLTTCKHIDFRTRLRGDVHDLHGLSVVASPPERRRRGHVRDLLAGSLEHSRSEDVYLSALWPFKRSFYAQYGWATCTRAVKHELDPAALSFAPAHGHGEFVELTADDWERADAVHDAHGERYELTMDRTEEWWRKRVFAGWDDDPYAYGFERDGELAAWVTYTFEDGDETALRVRDWACVDHDARLALLRFLADHDSQVDALHLWTHPDEDLLDLLPDTDDVDAELHLCPMVRLVDVPDALEALSYPADAAIDLVLDVDDPLADWNDGAFRFAVADGEATVEAVDSGSADVRLGVGTLSQLAAGYRSARDLAAVGDLTGDESAVANLADALPERPTFLREGF
ncbi:GNAT family N-acetyltransferase [Halobacterium sp. R2-5]|uniref:GNAT family N-acetyltransferase n=1 Tax=Halobacterium sp. R2-5 TaxID=2715751 RepID=UPI00141FFE05|nr:GNAT family N-acetyltransferase [Halobacterium sp. R2-5]NIB99340.1 GNAT family N-acetyltransferase [Halobacterium sp. R2-5]